MPFPLASPVEGSYREPQYQARIELYAQNFFTPAQYNKIKSRGISFCRGDADMIRHAFIGEADIQHKVQLFTGSAYVYDLAHALLLQVKRTVQQLVNVPEGLNTQTLMAVLYNLKGFKLKTIPGTDASDSVQLTALSSTDLRTLAQGNLKVNGQLYQPVRVPEVDAPSSTYPWGLTDNNNVAAECVVAQMIELCRDRTIDPGHFSLVQRAEVFQPLGLDISINRHTQGYDGEKDSQSTFGYREYNNLQSAIPAPLSIPMRNGNVIGSGNWKTAGGFRNVIREIQLPAGQSYGPTSVAGLDEVFRMEQERDAIIAILTQWGTTGLGLILGQQVKYSDYRAAASPEDVMGNKPAYSRFAEVNEMGDTCGPGYERMWYTGDPGDDKSRNVQGHIYMNGVKYKNPQATHAVCAPMTRQLRSMPYTKDVVTNPRVGVAMQRRARKRKAAKRRTTKRRR